MTQNREAFDVADEFVYKTGKGILTGDYPLFRAHFQLPYCVETNNTKETLTTEAEFRAMFDKVRAFYVEHDVQDLVRTVIAANFLDDETVGVTFVSSLILKERKEFDKPFPTYSVIRKIDGDWKIVSALYAILDNACLSNAFTPEMREHKPSRS